MGTAQTRRTFDFVRPIIAWPASTFMLFFAVTLILGVPALSMNFTTELADYLPEGYESVEVINEIFETWPIGSISILVEADDVTHVSVLQEMERVIGVIDYDPYDEGVNDGIASLVGLTYLIKTINKEVMLDSDAALSNTIPTDQDLIDFLITMLPESLTSGLLTADHQYALITLTANTRDVDPALLAEAVYAATADAQGCTMLAASSIFTDLAMQEQTGLFMDAILPIAALLVMLALYIVFRSVKKAVIAILPPVFAAIQTFGILTLTGQELGIITIAVGPLIIGFGVAYSVYVINRFIEERDRSGDAVTAIIKGGNKMLVAIFLSSVTTIVGFLSLALSDMPSTVMMGIACALGIALCFLSVTFVIPSLLALLSVDIDVDPHYEWRRREQRKRISIATTSQPEMTLTIAVVISLLAFSNLGNLTTDFTYDDLMPAGMQEMEDLDTVATHFGGGDVVFLLVSGDVYDQRVLGEMERVATKLTGINGVVYASSIVDVLKSANIEFDILDILSIFFGGDIEFTGGSLPATDAEVQGAYAKVDSNQVDLLVSKDRSKALLAVGLDAGLSPRQTEEAIAEINALVAEQQRPYVEFSKLSGIPVLTIEINQMIMENQQSTMLLSIFMVFLVILFIFRSLRLGLATLIPMLAVIIWNLGVMAALDISLNVATVMMTSILMGTGIDFGIQITQRIRQELYRGVNPREATRIAVQNQGISMIETAFITGAGFASVLFLPIPVIQGFIIMMLIGIVFSCVAAVFVLPAVYIKMADFGLIRESEIGGLALGDDDDITGEYIYESDNVRYERL